MNLQNKINKKYDQIKNLVQYKKKSEEEIHQIAKKMVEKEEKEKSRFQPEWRGLDKIDKKWANKRYKVYRDKFHIKNYSDLLLLMELVRRESLQENLWEDIGERSEKAKKADQMYVPNKRVMDRLNDNEKKILDLKSKLGLFDDKEVPEFVEVWKNILEQIDLYVNKGENGVVSHMKCPHCKRMVLLRKDLTDFETLPHPFFDDENYIWNKHLFDYLHEKKLTAEEVAKVLETSPQMINKLYKQKFLRENHK